VQQHLSEDRELPKGYSGTGKHQKKGEGNGRPVNPLSSGRTEVAGQGENLAKSAPWSIGVRERDQRLSDEGAGKTETEKVGTGPKTRTNVFKGVPAKHPQTRRRPSQGPGRSEKVGERAVTLRGGGRGARREGRREKGRGGKLGRETKELETDRPTNDYHGQGTSVRTDTRMLGRLDDLPRGRRGKKKKEIRRETRKKKRKCCEVRL